MNADLTSAGTTSSRSASESTITQFLPPISAITRLRCFCPGGVSAAARTMSSPTLLEPVNAIVCTRGSRTSAAPTSPSPGSSASALGGTPDSRSARVSTSAQPGDCSAGLRTTALPVASPAAVIPSAIATGKFQGEMTATMPRGVPAQLVALAGRLEQRGALREVDRPARVVLEEVDRLAHVGVGLGPRLRALAHRQRGDLEPPLAQPLRGAHQHLRPLLRRARPTSSPWPSAWSTSAGGRGRRLGHHAVGVAGVGRDDVRALAAVVADPHRHLERASASWLATAPARPARTDARRSSRIGSLAKGFTVAGTIAVAGPANFGH